MSTGAPLTVPNGALVMFGRGPDASEAVTLANPTSSVSSATAEVRRAVLRPVGARILRMGPPLALPLRGLGPGPRAGARRPVGRGARSHAPGGRWLPGRTTRRHVTGPASPPAAVSGGGDRARPRPPWPRPPPGRPGRLAREL